MKRASIFVVVLLLSGCGQSGPLYIPGSPSRVSVPAENPDNAQQTSEEEDDDNTSQ